MNKVYISGKIIEAPQIHLNDGSSPIYMTTTLCVTHKTRIGIRKYETYRINAWNRVAQWGLENLKLGQIVAIQGYLIQKSGNGPAVEIAVEEFLPIKMPMGAATTACISRDGATMPRVNAQVDFPDSVTVADDNVENVELEDS